MQNGGVIIAYIRTKKIKGKKYAYLVESKWDKEKKTSKQKVLEYLGSGSDCRLRHPQTIKSNSCSKHYD
jgi:hypothetical protein